MSRVREVDYRWHLRQLMATRGLFSTTDLAPLLAERGIELSAAQVYRLVTGTPERLNLHVLSALCDALGCSPADLVEPVVVTEAKRPRRAAGSKGSGSASADGKATRPTRAKIVPDR
jgi:DNA-binding Xre family transcriptional regulator